MIDNFYPDINKISAALINKNGELEYFKDKGYKDFGEVLKESKSRRTRQIAERADDKYFGNGIAWRLSKEGYIALTSGVASLKLSKQKYYNKYLYLPKETLSKDQEIDLDIILSYFDFGVNYKKLPKDQKLLIYIEGYYVDSLDLHSRPYSVQDILDIINTKRSEIMKRIEDREGR